MISIIMKKKNKDNNFVQHYLSDCSDLIKPNKEIIYKLNKIKDILLNVYKNNSKIYL